MERLTGCAEAATPCDFIQVAPSPDRNRLAAIRTTPEAAAGASALYFMDLSRSVETLIFPSRRVDSVDYSPDGSFIIYSAIVPQSTQEDLYYSQPNGTAEQNLTDSAAFRERSARIDPFARTAVYEGIDESGVSRIYLFSQTPLTSGPATGESLPGTPYVVGADADPVFSPDSLSVAFRRLTGVGNGGLGTWDVLTRAGGRRGGPAGRVLGAGLPGAAGLGLEGDRVRRDRRGRRALAARRGAARRLGPHRPPHRGRGLPDGRAPLAPGELTPAQRGNGFVSQPIRSVDSTNAAKARSPKRMRSRTVSRRSVANTVDTRAEKTTQRDEVRVHHFPRTPRAVSSASRTTRMLSSPPTAVNVLPYS